MPVNPGYKLFPSVHFPSNVRDDTQKRFFLTSRDKKAEDGRPDLVSDAFGGRPWSKGGMKKMNWDFKETSHAWRSVGGSWAR